MYHTFQANPASMSRADGEANGSGRLGASRRISTTIACLECRRRKIRCDGAQPCSQCQWYQHPQLCSYAKPAQRAVPSRKLVGKLQTEIEQARSIINRVFPGQDLETLASLPREELLNLALAVPGLTASPSTAGSEATPAISNTTQQTSDGAESLEALEQAPDQEPVADEATRHKDKIQGITDDVNGLSLSIDRPSSYVGVSSITAALKVIFKTAPIARPFIAQSYVETALPSRANTPPPVACEPDPYYLPSPDVGRALIDSYFKHVHVLMPTIDETQFYHTYSHTMRQDSPWLALLNMVFAFGSLAAGTCENEEHLAYFQRARKHLDLETFGSGNLLALQALGLLGGYYLHWLNRPNEANCLMGATIRMATALGLHREYREGLTPNSMASDPATANDNSAVEVRRRTWWTLIWLDTLAYMTIGRPALGRLGPGVTVQSPRIAGNAISTQDLASMRLLPLVHSIPFCRIATRIQDALAGRSMLSFEELRTFDAELVRWHDDLPPILRDVVAEPSSLKQRSGSKASATSARKFNSPNESNPGVSPCPEELRTPRAIMYWWYLTLRMLLYRPHLLAAALRRVPFSTLRPEEQVAVATCQRLAEQAIAAVIASCEETLIAGWNAVWLMHQNVMVPLVSLFAQFAASVGREGDADGDEEMETWTAQISRALAFFARMSRWSVAAKKSRDVVRRLYDASVHVRLLHAQQKPQVAQHVPATVRDGVVLQVPSEAAVLGASAGPPTFDGMEGSWTLGGSDTSMDAFWDEMMWESLSDAPDMAGVLSYESRGSEFAWMPPGGEGVG